MIAASTLALSQRVVEKLTASGKLLGLAESCTGGLIGACLTAIPGSSRILALGHIVYSNASKTQFLSVRPNTIAEFGAVSEAVAQEMVQGLLTLNPTLDIGLSVTGIAGPSGGSKEKPVGTVYIGYQCRGMDAKIFAYHFLGDRAAIRAASVESALEILINQP